jgi:exopolyphosphatase/guanosine-5'-triphosphate,3'-diphosphate pyrophosphatase
MQADFPYTLAAIDAGSNAIRIVVARAESPTKFQQLHAERVPLRLGEKVFTRRKFDLATIGKAVDVFRHFRELIDAHGARRYRAVATSATRVAENRDRLIDGVRRGAGMELEVISGEEEARLVTSAVIARFAPQPSPRVIVDMGGGSLEVNLLRRGAIVESRTFPLGAVRLMESMGLEGPLTGRQIELIRARVSSTLSLLDARLPYYRRGLAAGCGGNFETLARIAAGPRHGMEKTLDVYRLFERLRDIATRDVESRMARFKVRKDRAEVLAVAAVVIAEFGRYMNLSTIVSPGVGVREGILLGLAANGAPPAPAVPSALVDAPPAPAAPPA